MVKTAFGRGPRTEGAAFGRGPRTEGTASSSATSVGFAALSILEEHGRTGAPLDGVLGRYIRGRRELSTVRREELCERVTSVARRQGRLDWRLRNAGVEPSARSRLLADHALRRPTMEVGLPLSAAERGWLLDLAPPLETGSMDRRAALECPEWAWGPLRATFGEEGVDRELRAL